MAAAGLPVRGRFRAAQAPFHASLFSAHVGAHVDMSEVIALAQSTLPAGGGLNAEPILIDSFQFQGRTFHAQQLKADDEAGAPLYKLPVPAASSASEAADGRIAVE